MGSVGFLKDQRGGYRVGAGRKKTASEEFRASLTIRILPKTRERLDQLKGHLSYGKLIDKIVESLYPLVRVKQEQT